MRIRGRWHAILPFVIAITLAAPAAAQQPEQAAPSAKPAPAKKPSKKPKTQPAATATAPKPAAAPSTKPATPPAVGGVKPTLLGQYAEWGAYTATPGGKRICFAIAKPTSEQTNPPNRPRNPTFMFVTSRPADKVSNEVSIIIGYSFKPGSEASVDVGTTSYALYTQQDGAWIKNAAEEAQLVDAMRQGDTAVVKGVSAKGTQSTDTYSLKGLTQALQRVAQECK